MPVGGPGQAKATDDRGHFRIFGLAPGTYYVGALQGAFAAQAETGGFAPSYYPGTADVMAATLMLATSDRLGISDLNITRGTTELDGSFTFRNVPPGSYALQGYGAQVDPKAGNLGASEFG